MTIGQSYFLGSLGIFGAFYAFFLYLRYACANRLVRWHFLLWMPFAATIALSVLMLLYTLNPKGEWDMGPSIAMIFIIPFLIALAVVVYFRPTKEALYKPTLIAAGIFYAAYIIGFMYFVVSPIGRLKL